MTTQREIADALPGLPGAIDSIKKSVSNFSSYTALQASDPLRKSAFLVGDTDTNPRSDGIYTNPTGTPGGWVPQSAAGVIFTPSFSGAIKRTSLSRLQDMGVSPRDYGAVGDGATDDSDAVQKAINACLAVNPPRPLRVDGRFGLSKSVNIDRPVDQSVQRFLIYGAGMGGGFYPLGNINIFDTTIAPSDSSFVSERLFFQDILFKAPSPTIGGQTFATNKFGRLDFLNCEWVFMKFMGTTKFTQSIRMRQCRANEWSGTWYQSGGGYDLDVELETRLGGGTVFIWSSATRPVLRCAIRNGVFEGIQGSVLIASNVYGLTFADNYCEFNANEALNFNPSGGLSNRVIKVSGNTFQQTDAQYGSGTFYDIIWGPTARAHSSGNWCSGRLHDPTGVVGLDRQLTIDGDYAELELYKGHKTGFYDPAWAGVGNVRTCDKGINVVAIGASYTGYDANMQAQIVGPGPVLGGANVPIRTMVGTQNPGANPGFYGNIYWAQGSTVRNIGAGGDGQAREWVCTVSGQPGTWRTQIMQ